MTVLKLNTVGCSFTYAQRQGWPDMLAAKIESTKNIKVDLRNEGHPGAGNTYVANKILLDTQYRTNIDLAVIMWSGLTRKDVLIDKDNKDVKNALTDYGYVRWANRDTEYVFSGGIVGSWMHHPMTEQIFGPLYKISNNRSMAAETLIHILMLQNYFKANNIPYIMTSYVNYWTDEARVADLDFGIAQFADLQYLVKQIDFDRWLFANDRKDCIYELAKQNNDLQEDGWHPDFATHDKWADLLIKKLESDNFFNKL